MRLNDNHVLSIYVFGDAPEAEQLLEPVAARSGYRLQLRRCPPEDSSSAANASLCLLDIDAIGDTAFQVVKDLGTRYPLCPTLGLVSAAQMELADSLLEAGLDDVGLRCGGSTAYIPIIAKKLGVLLGVNERGQLLAGARRQIAAEALYQNTDAAFVIIDLDYRIVFFNARANTLHEQTWGRNLHLGESVYELLAPADRAAFAMHFDTARRGEPLLVRKNVARVGPPDAWHEYLLQPVQDAAGRVIAVSVQIRDISARRQLEEELQQAEERFWAFFERVNFGVAVIDRDLRLVDANPPLSKMLGRSQPALREHSFIQLAEPAAAGSATGQLDRLVRKEQSYADFELKLTSDRDEPVPTNVIAWPVHDSSGAVRYLVALVFDISQRKQTRDQLERAERLRAIGSLAGGIAHEYNNLLMAVAVYDQLIRLDMSESNPQWGYTEKILEAVNRGKALSNQLLAYSKQRPVQPRVLDLNGFVEDMKHFLSKMLDERICVELTVTTEPLPVRADPNQLEQLLVNLSLNAADAMPAGGRLTLRTRLLQQQPTAAPGSIVVGTPIAGPCAALHVVDTGHGMDRDTLERIFEPFFSTRGINHATGLGLPIVYRTVEDMSGAIAVNSQVDRGTCVEVYFPLAQHETEAPDHSTPVNRPAEPQTTAHAQTASGSPRVLVVEDDADVGSAIASALRQRGFAVELAATPSRARELVEQSNGSFDIVLTDVLLPESSGPEMVDAMRARQPDLPVVFITGYAPEDVIERLGRPLPRGPLVEKPVSIEQLVETITEALPAERRPPSA